MTKAQGGAGFSPGALMPVSLPVPAGRGVDSATESSSPRASQGPPLNRRALRSSDRSRDRRGGRAVRQVALERLAVSPRSLGTPRASCQANVPCSRGAHAGGDARRAPQRRSLVKDHAHGDLGEKGVEAALAEESLHEASLYELAPDLRRDAARQHHAGQGERG